MYYYFSASYTTAIKLNGVYFGILGEEKKQINVLTPSPLVELIPLNGAPPTSFILNQQFLASPVDSVNVVDLNGGYYIHFEKVLNGQKYGVVAQKRLKQALVTLFYDGALKLSIETSEGFYTELIPSNCLECELIEIKNANAVAVKANCDKEKRVFVYTLNKDVKQIFDYTASEIEISENIITRESKADVLKHLLTCEWQIENNEVTLKNRTVTAKDENKKDKLTKEIIPYAFLEEFLVGGDFTYFMCENMQSNAPKLKAYLGEFIGIMPPPHFIPFNKIGLIRKIGERLYKVDYLTVTVENNKVTNIRLN